MNTYIIEHDGKKYIRISKAKAKQLHSILVEVFIDSSKMCPFNSWGTTFIIPTWERMQSENYTFDMYVDAWKGYNCDSERGYYPAFYTELTEK